MDPASSDTVLMMACRTGHEEMVRYCLHHGAKNDPHPDFGQTALHAAVSSGQFSCARILLEEAADSGAAGLIANLTDPRGQTALHVASSMGHEELVILLLHHGSIVNTVDCQGNTALHLACMGGHKACLAVLMDHGGDELIDQPDLNGNTALHLAAHNGSIACSRLLLETAANVVARNAEGLTPYAVSSRAGQHQIGLLLLKYHDNTPALEKAVESEREPKTLFGPQISDQSSSRGGDKKSVAQSAINSISQRVSKNRQSNSADDNPYNISDDDDDTNSDVNGGDYAGQGIKIDMPPTPKHSHSRVGAREQVGDGQSNPFSPNLKPINDAAVYKGSLPQPMPESPLPRPYENSPVQGSSSSLPRKSIPVQAAPVPFHQHNVVSSSPAAVPMHNPHSIQQQKQPPPPPGPPPAMLLSSNKLAPPISHMDANYYGQHQDAAELQLDFDYERLSKMSLFDGMTVLESKNTPPPAHLSNPGQIISNSRHDMSRSPTHHPNESMAAKSSLNDGQQLPTIAISFDITNDDLSENDDRAGEMVSVKNENESDLSLRRNCEVCGKVGWCGRADHARTDIGIINDEDENSQSSSGNSMSSPRNVHRWIDEKSDSEGRAGEEKVFNSSGRVMKMHEVYPERNIKGSVAPENDNSFYAQDEVELIMAYDGGIDETQTTVPPIEEFDYLSAPYHVYVTEEGYTYYLDMHSGHSQWDDPRVYGLAVDYEEPFGEEVSLETLLERQDEQQLKPAISTDVLNTVQVTKVLHFSDENDKSSEEDDGAYRSFSNDDEGTDWDSPAPEVVKLRVIPREGVVTGPSQLDTAGTSAADDRQEIEANVMETKKNDNIISNSSNNTSTPRKGRPPPIEILPVAPHTPQNFTLAARKRSPGQASPYSTPSNRSVQSRGSSNSSSPTHARFHTPTHARQTSLVSEDNEEGAS